MEKFSTQIQNDNERRKGLSDLRKLILASAISILPQNSEAFEFPKDTSWLSGIEILQDEVSRKTEKFAFFVLDENGNGEFIYTIEGKEQSVSFNHRDIVDNLRSLGDEIGVLKKFCSIHTHPLDTETSKQMIGPSPLDVAPHQRWNSSNYNDNYFRKFSFPLSTIEQQELVITTWGGFYHEDATPDELLRMVPSFKEKGNQLEENLSVINQSIKRYIFDQIEIHGFATYKNLLPIVTGVSKEVADLASSPEDLVKVIAGHTIILLRQGQISTNLNDMLAKLEFSPLKSEVDLVLQIVNERQRFIWGGESQYLKSDIGNIQHDNPEVASMSELPPDFVRQMEESYARSGILLRYVTNDQLLQEPPCAGAKFGRE